MTESPSEEARLLAETAERDRRIQRGVERLQQEGVSEALAFTLCVLLDPTLVPVDEQSEAIADYVLRLIAARELDAEAADCHRAEHGRGVGRESFSDGPAYLLPDSDARDGFVQNPPFEIRDRMVLGSS